MFKSKVSVRGQTVIPQEIREQLGIEPQSELRWFVEDGVVKIVPLSADPLAATRGLLANMTAKELQDERARDQKQERQREDRLMKQFDSPRRSKRAS